MKIYRRLPAISINFKKAARMVENGKGGESKINALVSYYGWLKHGSGRNLWVRHITDNLKQRVATSLGDRVPGPLKMEAI